MGVRHLYQARVTKNVLIKGTIGFSIFVIIGIVFTFIFPKEKYYDNNDKNHYSVQDADRDIEHALLIIKNRNPGNEHLTIEDLRLDENYRYKPIKFCVIFGIIMVFAWIGLRFLNRLFYGEDDDDDW